MAAIAPWFCLRLPSCGPGFESQAHHLSFFQFVLKLLQEKNKNKQKKRPELAHFFKKIIQMASKATYEYERNQIEAVLANHQASVLVEYINTGAIFNFQRNKSKAV